MTKILITGGAGYIGSHISLVFLKAGYQVVILDNFSNSSAEIVQTISKLANQNLEICQADIRDKNALSGLFRSHKFEAIVHCAGLKSVSESAISPLKYYDNNVLGTICLLEAMAKADITKIIFSSSATVYGNPHYLPMDEDHPKSPTNPYGRTKLMIEDMLIDIQKSKQNMNTAILRYFNPAGAHKSGQLGEKPKGTPANLVPFLSQAASGQREIVNVWGNDYDTFDGTGIRDYIHILDLANAHLKAFEYINTQQSSVTLNIGTGFGYSVMEVIEAFEKASNKKLNIKIAERRAGDVASCYANVELAETLMGWKAVYGLKEMCEDQWRWESNHI